MTSSTTLSYEQTYKASIEDPESFWGEIARGVRWQTHWNRVLDDSDAPLYRWFPGGRLNTCDNALDRHVEAGRGDQPAIIYDSAMTRTKRTITYKQLLDETAIFAGALRGLGVNKGDRVVIYMPMIPEAVVAMLACARLGAVHSVVFGGFAPKELAKRIDDAAPKLIVSATCGLEPNRTIAYKPLLDEAIRCANHKPGHCVIVERPECEAAMVEGRDVSWADAVSDAEPADCVTVEATDPLYVLYTSGTTGTPKGVVRDNGGHAVALTWSMKAIYDIGPGDVFWAASDIGWVVGHSYIVYAPLLAGATSVLYEGKPVGTPDAGAFWRVIRDSKVKALFTAPTAFRAIKREDPEAELLAGYDISSLTHLFLAGERCDPDTLEWAGRTLGVPVIDHWWQTETGWAMAANCAGIELLPIKPGSPTKAVPGWDLRVVDDEGDEVPAGTIGNIVVKLPLPPGSLPTLFHNDEGYKRSYLSRFEGYYETSDAGFIDEDGYVSIMSRVDDIINVAGHRLSTGGMEEVLSAHPDVAECAVIGVADTLKGEVPVGLVVLKHGHERDPSEIKAELVQGVRTAIGAVAAFKRVLVVQRLPKTRSGKILRRVMRAVADGKEYTVPATIDDPTIIDEIKQAFEREGAC